MWQLKDNKNSTKIHPSPQTQANKLTLRISALQSKTLFNNYSSSTTSKKKPEVVVTSAAATNPST